MSSPESEPRSATKDRCRECYHKPHSEMCSVILIEWKDGIKGAGICGCSHGVGGRVMLEPVNINILSKYIGKLVRIEVTDIQYGADSFTAAIGNFRGFKAELNINKNRYAELIFEAFTMRIPYQLEARPYLRIQIEELTT